MTLTAASKEYQRVHAVKAITRMKEYQMERVTIRLDGRDWGLFVHRQSRGFPRVAVCTPGGDIWYTRVLDGLKCRIGWKSQ